MRMEWSQGVIICDYSSCRGVVFFKIRLILRGSFLSFYGVIICDYLSCRGVFFIFLCGHYLWLFIMQRGGFLKYFMGSFFVIICHAQGCFLSFYWVVLCDYLSRRGVGFYYYSSCRGVVFLNLFIRLFFVIICCREKKLDLDFY